MIHNFSDVTSENEVKRLGKLYPIILAEYNPAYVERYLEESRFLLKVFGDAVLRINHIGSTAVPGLLAKPTIDILLEIKENIDLTAITEQLLDMGYVVNKPKTDIITYLKGYTSQGFVGQTFHIHIRHLDDWGELYFKDYLIEYHETAEEYAKLKRKLQLEFEQDRDGYTYGKGEFVSKITELARIKYAGRYTSK